VRLTQHLKKDDVHPMGRHKDFKGRQPFQFQHVVSFMELCDMDPVAKAIYDDHLHGRNTTDTVDTALTRHSNATSANSTDGSDSGSNATSKANTIDKAIALTAGGAPRSFPGSNFGFPSQDPVAHFPASHFGFPNQDPMAHSAASFSQSYTTFLNKGMPCPENRRLEQATTSPKDVFIPAHVVTENTKVTAPRHSKQASLSDVQRNHDVSTYDNVAFDRRDDTVSHLTENQSVQVIHLVPTSCSSSFDLIFSQTEYLFL